MKWNRHIHVHLHVVDYMFGMSNVYTAIYMSIVIIHIITSIYQSPMYSYSIRAHDTREFLLIIRGIAREANTGSFNMINVTRWVIVRT